MPAVELRPPLQTEDEESVHLQQDDQGVLAREENVHMRDDSKSKRV